MSVAVAEVRSDPPLDELIPALTPFEPVARSRTGDVSIVADRVRKDAEVPESEQSAKACMSALPVTGAIKTCAGMTFNWFRGLPPFQNLPL